MQLATRSGPELVQFSSDTVVGVATEESYLHS